MGASLNPRIGPIDLKMWAEVRIPWILVFFLSVSGGCKQYEQLGYITPVSTTYMHNTIPLIVLRTWLS
jgi:delta24(24(1))-sterol reductase